MILEKIRRAGIEIVGDVTYRDKRCPKEDAELVTFINEWRIDPQLSEFIVIHIPNEKKRRKKEDFAELKKQRMKGAFVPGASDIVAVGHPTLIIELKRIDHTLSDIEDEQIEFLSKAIESDAWVCIALGYKNALKFAREWYEANYL